MTATRVGALKLGLDLQWQTAFVARDSKLQPQRDAVALDVGGCLAPGMIDQQHCTATAGSAAELVLLFPEYCYGHLMDDWLRRRDDGQDLRGRPFAPTIVLHAEPDFDALVAWHLCKQLIEYGELPAYASALASYTSRVDQGKCAMTQQAHAAEQYPLHIGYLALQNLDAKGPLHDRDHQALTAGEEMLLVTVEALARVRGGAQRITSADFEAASAGAASDDEPGTAPYAAWQMRPQFSAAKQLVAEDYQLYLLDRADALLYGPDEDLGPLELPVGSRSATTLQARALVLTTPPRSRLNKYWVRAENFAYFVCPYSAASQRQFTADTKHFGRSNQTIYPRVVLSVDPNWRDPATNLPLRLAGLGRSLEQAECTTRQAMTGGDVRAMVPRWSDGSVMNADPWYDGRGHNHTIVASPACGTRLTCAEVLAIATGKFFRVPLVAAELFLVLPATEMQATGAGLTPPPPLVDSLRRLYADWRQSAPSHRALPATHRWRPAAELLMASGFAVEIGQRIPPTCLTAAEGQPVSPPLDTLLACWPAPGSTTEQGLLSLEELATWVEEQDQACGHRAYVVASVRLAPGQAQSPQVDAILERLCLGKTERAGDGDDDRVILFNGRAVATHLLRSAESTDSHNMLLRELLLYAAFQAETLAAFTRAIAEGVTAKTLKVAALAAIRRQFVAFQVKYVVLEPIRDAGHRQVFKGICEWLGIDAQRAKLNTEIARLEQFARDRSDARKQATEGKMNLVLFFLALSGIVEAVMADWEHCSRLQAVLLGAGLGLTLLAVGLIWRRRARRVVAEADPT